MRNFYFLQKKYRLIRKNLSGFPVKITKSSVLLFLLYNRITDFILSFVIF